MQFFPDFFWLRHELLHHYLDFLEQLHCSVPWDSHPLEHKWFTCEIIHFFV